MIESYQLPMLHTPSMNDTHFETVQLLNALSAAMQSGDTHEIGNRFDALFEHTQAHYREEEALMLEKKFPPYPAHKEEHDDNLEQLQKAASAFAETKDIVALGKYMELELIPWFLKHTETMEAVTSIFLENSEVHLPYWERLVPRKQ